MSDQEHLKSRIKNLKQAVLAEIEHEKEAYRYIINQIPLNQKVAEGYCWYPIAVDNTGYTIGDHPWIQLSIDISKWVPNLMRSGSIIRLFRNNDGDISTESTEATIYSIQKNNAKIILNDNELPEWLSSGKLGIVLDYDQKSNDEMLIALKSIADAKDTAASDIRDIIYSNRKISCSPQPFTPINLGLNDSQILAVQNLISFPILSVIHGPPGTGKTTTLVEAITQTARKSNKILVTAPSNSAVDLLVEKIAANGINTLRIGNISRVKDEVVHQTLEYKVESSREFHDIKKLRKELAECQRKVNTYKRNFGPEQKAERQALYREIKDIRQQISQIEEYMVRNILNDAQVICTTLVGSSHPYLNSITFDFCYIDECSQALEPATWIPILKSKAVVLAGDPFQLPPTVKSSEAQRLGLSTTLLDLAYLNGHNVHLLDTQYRMHPDIMHFSNVFFYQSKLKAAQEMSENRISGISLSNHAMVWIDTSGSGYHEMENPHSKSFYNPDEAMLTLKLLDQMLYELSYLNKSASIGVISPYREQTHCLSNLDAENKLLSQEYNIQFQTIDSFQGQERDIIFINLVRSNERNEIGFLKDYRRMNVAMTRAKSLLVIIGDSATVGNDPFYSQLLDYCISNSFYRSVFEFIEY